MQFSTYSNPLMVTNSMYDLNRSLLKTTPSDEPEVLTIESKPVVYL
jgi:hypothetical protein